MLEEDILNKLKKSLFLGQYNLLLGAGISLDSKNGKGDYLLGAHDLAQKIRELKNIRNRYPLSRLCESLSQKERKEYLTDSFSNCNPGNTVKRIPNYIWKKIFTFNIDDVIENLYKDCEFSKQRINSLNYKDIYTTEKNIHQLLLIHLHGFVGRSEDGYVFSNFDYANNQTSQNPWIHILSELLESEPFIISGTSLDEPDLNYYLSVRNNRSGRHDRGPSILVEPNPDELTDGICKRHGLILVRATFGDFLDWLYEKTGDPPSLESLFVPQKGDVFKPELSKNKRISFFSSFERVEKVLASNKDGISSGYYKGLIPSWNDIASSLDVPVEDELLLISEIQSFLKDNRTGSCIVLTGEPGSGKSTVIRHVAYDLAEKGNNVFFFKENSIYNKEDILECITNIEKKCVIVIDNLATNVNVARDILESVEFDSKLIILSAERSYRREHIDNSLNSLSYRYIDIKNWTASNYIQLIKKFNKFGLIADNESVSNPDKRALEFEKNEEIASATCRILNDFHPMERIVKSVWNDSEPATKFTYLLAALSEYCSKSGVNYSILRKASLNDKLNLQIDYYHPLPLCFTSSRDDYVLPLNATIGERFLFFVRDNYINYLFKAFVALGKTIAPYVNRSTIKARTSESILSARLLRYENVVDDLLGLELGEKFYKEIQEEWKWNSRYWENRALLVAENNLDLGIQHARHAVSIERHPFPWTTLAALLLRKMNVNNKSEIFNEIFDLLIRAFDYDKYLLRHQGAHAYNVFFRGVIKFIEFNGVLGNVKKQEIKSRIVEANQIFSRRGDILKIISLVENLLH